MGGIANRVIKGSGWLGIARAIVNALALLSTIVLARLLSPADFGLVAIGTTLLVLVSAATEFSLAQALVQHRAPTEAHFHSAWTLNAARGLLVGGAFAAAGFPTAAIYGEPRLAGIMGALGLSILLSGLTNPRRIMLQRKLIFWQDFVLNVSQKLAGVIASIAVALIYQSYWALVVGALVTQATNVIVSYTVLPFRPRLMLRHGRELFGFSAWLTFGQFINVLNWRFDYLLIGKVLGKVDLGYYSVGSNLALLATRETIAPLTQALFPGFSLLVGDRDRLAAGYQRAQSLTTAIALPAGIGAALVADPLIRLTMGEQWTPAIFIVQALSSIFAIQTLGTLAQPLGMARGDTRILFIRDLQMLALRVPLLVGGLLLFGLPGVIVARLCTGLTGTLQNMLLVRRFVGLRLGEQLAANGRAIAGALVMAAGVLTGSFVMPHATAAGDLMMQLVLLTSVGALFYCGTTYLLWRAMGRPSGPETEIAGVVANLHARFFSHGRLDRKGE